MVVVAPEQLVDHQVPANPDPALEGAGRLVLDEPAVLGESVLDRSEGYERWHSSPPWSHRARPAISASSASVRTMGFPRMLLADFARSTSAGTASAVIP